MKKRLGICVYPEKTGIDKTIAYIKMAKDHGFERVFANLIEIKNNANGQKRLSDMAKVYKFASDNKMEMILDVNPNFYKEFNLKPTELSFFKKLGATGIRLDEDFKGVIEAELSKNKIGMKVELNASAGHSTFEKALANGGNPKNLFACHNFYPMVYTGLDLKKFVELSTYYKLHDIRVAAFVTLPEDQKGVGPWNVNNGMVTIEEHRYMDLIDQVVDLLASNVVDDIIISQQGANAKQFSEIKKVLDFYLGLEKKASFELPVKLIKNVGEVERQIALDNFGKLHTNRPDYSSYMYRSTWPRVNYKDYEVNPRNSGLKLKLGDVIVLNKNLGRYKGELHVLFKDIDDSQAKSRNKIGTVQMDKRLLRLLKGKQIKVKEV